MKRERIIYDVIILLCFFVVATPIGAIYNTIALVCLVACIGRIVYLRKKIKEAEGE